MDDADFLLEDDVDSIEEKEVREKKNAYIMRVQLAMFVSILVFVVCCFVITVSVVMVGLYIVKEIGPREPSYFSPDDMQRTVEFQLDLKPVEDWVDRSVMLERWMNFINTNSDIMLYYDNADEEIYSQYHYDVYGRQRCNTPSDVRIRYRSFVYGRKNEITIKKDEELGEKCNQAFWPAEKYYNISRQKCEEDVHPCFNKFCRETTVTFDTPNRDYSTCADLVDVFPDAFPNLLDSEVNNHIRKKSTEIWWKLKWTGSIGMATTYQVTFNINYASESSAITGYAPIIQGEFSLRYFTPAGVDWEVDVVDELQELYFSLIVEFDPDEQHLYCEEEFEEGIAPSYIGVAMEDQFVLGH